MLITLVEDDPGTGVGLLISAKRKIFAILKYKIKKIILTNIEHKLQTNVLKIKFYDLISKRNSLTNSEHKLTKINKCCFNPQIFFTFCRICQKRREVFTFFGQFRREMICYLFAVSIQYDTWHTKRSPTTI